MEMTGSRILMESLKKEGVKVLFGYPGGQVIPIFDALYDEKNIELVHVRHEQGAAHMADGYARATGEVGVCLATSGPGATNLVTGIATAYMDSIPMVAITGQVPTSMIGSDAFQEADITGITRPITKHNFLVKDIHDLALTIKNAFYLARTGRPGPVLVDIPKDVQVAKHNFVWPEMVELRSYKPKTKVHVGQIKKAMTLIEESQRPIIYFGGGVILGNASKELCEFVKKTGIPVTSTLTGLGAYPADYSDPLYLGMLGMHGTVYANLTISHSDLIIAIGSRFDDRVTGKLSEFAPNAKIIHIDIDPTSISKNVIVDVPIVGDVKEVLTEFNKLMKPSKISEWLEQIAEWKKKNPLGYGKSDTVIKPQNVIEILSRMTKGDVIISTEVGQNQMWAAQFFEYKKPRTLLTSGGLGTMGYGLPAAIGAQAAFRDKTVIDIAGDGSIQMNIQELGTAISHDLNVKVIILNNSYLGMVRQWQELFYNKRYSGVLMEKHSHNQSTGEYYPDFVKVAEAYGCWGKRITLPSEIEGAIREMIDYKGPAILDVVIEKEENVLPMVPAGASLTQMIGGMA
ncbi:MAG: acetolactate synthase, large subunit, biosynthetic type [Spirochaetes bacterium GWF1_51_8]|nr:MAG: acetolactate synthase, large subunit, biosynthetic type [Spirochaetes bacterium GWF1_51_8]